MLETFLWLACFVFAWVTLVSIAAKQSWVEYGKTLLFAVFGVVAVFGLMAFGPRDPFRFFVVFVALCLVSYFVADALGQINRPWPF